MTDHWHPHCPLCGACCPILHQMPGDLALCPDCGMASTFTADLDLRVSSGDEVTRRLMEDERIADWMATKHNGVQ